MSQFWNFVSPAFLLDDLCRLITTVPVKVQKRILRVMVVLACLGRSPNDVNSLPLIAEIITPPFTATDVDNFLKTPSTEFDDIIKFGKNRQDDTLKKSIEALLTAGLNSDLSIYEASYKLVVRLLIRLENDIYFGSLIAQKKLIMVFKGGIASRLVLLALFPKFKNEIKKSFGLGGDNDCSFMLDPELPDFDEIHSKLTDFCHKFLYEVAGSMGCGKAAHYARKVKSVNLNGINIPVEPAERHSFHVRDNQIMTMDYIHRKSVYVSRNDTLDFHVFGSRACFVLIRIKQAYKVANKVMGAEILDIAIPRRADVDYVTHFKHFRDGTYITRACLRDGWLVLESSFKKKT